MACALTSGYSLDCRDSVGGIKSVYFISIDNVTGVTNSAGVVTAITKANGGRFYKYNLVKSTSNAAETVTGNRENGSIFYAQSLTVILNKMQAATRNEILLLAQNRLLAVIEDRNGKYWLYGKENGLMLDSGTAATGTALGDRNGYELTFTGEEPALALEVNTSTVATLETP